MLAAVMFDVDGVLLDTARANVAYYKAILRDAGYPEPSEDSCSAVAHLTFHDALRSLAGMSSDDPLDGILRVVERHRFPYDLATIPHGASQAVISLSKRYRLAIVTNRFRASLGRFFGVFGLADRFEVTITCEDVIEPKPSPEPLLTAAAALGIAPSDAIYVGDTRSDVAAARAAGLRVVILGTDPDIGGDRTISSMEELEEVVDELKGRK